VRACSVGGPALEASAARVRLIPIPDLKITTLAWKEPCNAMATGRNRILIGIVVGLGLCSHGSIRTLAAQGDDKHPVVVLDTSFGPIAIELDLEKAPITAQNFLRYVDDGFFDNLIFHRVIPRFMIQGGGFDKDMREKSDGQHGKIKNESGNGLRNVRGSISMARTDDPDSAQNQFFINLVDNNRLDTYGGGYAVFGKVVDGIDVVDKIAKVSTGVHGGHPDVPDEPVIIKTARRKAKN
jgi:cyclophilin family peptidyl-prolyl cis-trans isomerase